jgi:hypothetical protein
MTTWVERARRVPPPPRAEQVHAVVGHRGAQAVRDHRAPGRALLRPGTLDPLGDLLDDVGAHELPVPAQAPVHQDVGGVAPEERLLAGAGERVERPAERVVRVE